MDDTAIELERKALRAQKREIEEQLATLLTSSEIEERKQREERQRDGDACKEKCAVGFGVWVIGLVLLGLLVFAGAVLHAYATDCSMANAWKNRFEHAKLPACNDIPFVVAVVLVGLGLAPCLAIVGA